MWELILVVVSALSWGSFLNVIAYRTTFDKKLFSRRSFCPSCAHTIAWYDNIPFISWIMLGARCRGCNSTISYLYPLIEFLAAFLVTALWIKSFVLLPLIDNWLVLIKMATIVPILQLSPDRFMYFVVYFVFISSLIVIVRCDLEAMVIPQIFTLWLLPIGIIAAFFEVIPITLMQSLVGGVVGYGLVWLIKIAFWYMTKREGIGVGDMELLALIGVFLGPLGVWSALMIGSITGLIIGGSYIWWSGKGRGAKIPFGPFLALGAFMYFFCEDYLLSIFLG